MKGKIGLEVHGYIKTKEKLFCRCAAHRERGTKPNTFICPLCCGMPGAKPMLVNEEAVKKAIMIGLMLKCKINENWKWQRKHYDWPDMPKGYQNTISGSYAVPVGVEGNFFGIKIRSIHLEEDPASWEPLTGRVDYNRSGLPLVEIITEPDFSTAEEVMNWLKRLIHHLSYLKSVDSNAGIKVDVNVSVLGERVEIKNISSVEDIGRAIDFELERQLREGGRRETRRFDSGEGRTEVMREKEEAEDYRFITDPDLQDVVIDGKFVREMKEKMPESPEDKLERFVKKHNLGKKDAEVLAQNIDVAEFFEEVVDSGIDAKFALPWVTVELLRHLNYNKTNLDNIEIKVEHFVALLKLVRSGKITELQGKQILNKFYPKSFDPSKKVEEKISGEKELEQIAFIVIKNNKKAVEDYKSGDERSINFLIGQIMAKTNRRADFKVARRVLEKLLGDR